MLIWSFTLENSTLILLCFFLSWIVFFCTTKHRFVKYTPKKCFSSFVQSVVYARKQGDENPNWNVVAEAMRLLANSSYADQIKIAANTLRQNI